MVGKPFEKGKSGNPNGRPSGAQEITKLAREHSTAAIERLVEWMNSDNAKASVAAADKILDRAYGKPKQTIGGDSENPIRAKIEVEFVKARLANPVP